MHGQIRQERVKLNPYTPQQITGPFAPKGLSSRRVLEEDVEQPKCTADK